MKIKRFFIGLSMISFLAFSFISCSEEGTMGIGESAGDDDPPRKSQSVATENLTDSISFYRNDNTDTFDLP